MSTVHIKDLLENFELVLIAGADGLHREIISSDISRPAIEMTGYFNHYPKEKLQLIGKTEMAYFQSLNEVDRIHRVDHLFTEYTPGIIISRGMVIPEVMINTANIVGVPILQSTSNTKKTISRITTYLESRLAPFTTVHGVLVDISGIGVLITGQSGIGKSEVALELVKRGHRLVADDSVEIRREDYDNLVGNSPTLIKHLLEIRGLGIINILTLLGTGAVKDYKKISLIIHLETWNQRKKYDRLGLGAETMQIMDVHLPRSIIPVRPGRNLAIIVEVAAMNFRLKKMGINAAEEFSDRLSTLIERERDEMNEE